MGLFEEVNQAFSDVVYDGDASQLDAAVSTHGEGAVSDQATELGYNLYDYWPPQSPSGGSGISSVSGRMTRGDYSGGSGLSTLDDALRSPAVDASGISKSELVSNPDSEFYDPMSPFYRAELDYMSGEYGDEEEKPKKKSKAGLWGFALLIAALAFGA